MMEMFEQLKLMEWNTAKSIENRLLIPRNFDS